MAEIKKQIESIIKEYTDAPIAEFEQANNFAELSIDSLSVVEIVFDIEETFDIKIPNDSELLTQGLAINNFLDVVKIVEQLIEEKQ